MIGGAPLQRTVHLQSLGRAVPSMGIAVLLGQNQPRRERGGGVAPIYTRSQNANKYTPVTHEACVDCGRQILKPHFQTLRRAPVFPPLVRRAAGVTTVFVFTQERMKAVLLVPPSTLGPSSTSQILAQNCQGSQGGAPTGSRAGTADECRSIQDPVRT